MSDSARTAASGAGGTGGEARPARDDAARRGLFARIVLFVRQVVAEMKKVVWLTRSDLVTYTIVVLVFVAVIMLYVTGVDLAVGSAVGWVFGG